MGTVDSASRDVVLAPLLADPPEKSDLSLPVALARAADAELVVVAPAVRPGHDPTDFGRGALTSECAAARTASRALDGFDGRVSTTVRLGESLTQVFAAAALEHDADVVAFAEIDRAFGDRHPSVDSLVDATPCDVATLTGTGALTDVSSVLAAIADGTHSNLASAVADELATAAGADLTLLRVVDPSASDDDRANALASLEGAVENCIDPTRVSARLTEAADSAAEILDLADEYDVAVLGGPESGALRRFAFGSTADDVRAATTTPVVTVWSA